MKKLFLFAVISFLALPTIKAQNFGYQLLFGANFCQIDGDQMGGFNKLGYRLGFGSYLNNAKGDEYGFEITYCEKGSRTANDPDNPAQIIVRYHYNYVEIPLYYQKKMDHFGLRIALAPAINVRARADLGGGFADQTNLRRFELSGIIGPSYELTENWRFYAHYQYSLLSIIDLQKSQVPGSQFRRTGVYNHLISAGFQYVLK